MQQKSIPIYRSVVTAGLDRALGGNFRYFNGFSCMEHLHLSNNSRKIFGGNALQLQRQKPIPEFVIGILGSVYTARGQGGQPT